MIRISATAACARGRHPRPLRHGPAAQTACRGVAGAPTCGVEAAGDEPVDRLSFGRLFRRSGPMMPRSFPCPALTLAFAASASRPAGRESRRYRSACCCASTRARRPTRSRSPAARCSSAHRSACRRASAASPPASRADGSERRRIDERYTLPHGKVRDVHYEANELTAALHQRGRQQARGHLPGEQPRRRLRLPHLRTGEAPHHHRARADRLQASRATPPPSSRSRRRPARAGWRPSRATRRPT